MKIRNTASSAKGHLKVVLGDGQLESRLPPTQWADESTMDARPIRVGVLAWQGAAHVYTDSFHAVIFSLKNQDSGFGLLYMKRSGLRG